MQYSFWISSYLFSLYIWCIEVGTLAQRYKIFHTTRRFNRIFSNTHSYSGLRRKIKTKTNIKCNGKWKTLDIWAVCYTVTLHRIAYTQTNTHQIQNWTQFNKEMWRRAFVCISQCKSKIYFYCRIIDGALTRIHIYMWVWANVYLSECLLDMHATYFFPFHHLIFSEKNKKRKQQRSMMHMHLLVCRTASCWNQRPRIHEKWEWIRHRWCDYQI